jgi:hypothetical protein
MPSKTDSSAASSTLSSGVRTVFSVRNLLMVAAGVLAGAGIVFVGKDAVVVPLIGSIPGPVIGGIGLAVGFAVYRRKGCNCGEPCGCSGDCDDRCSYDP